MLDIASGTLVPYAVADEHFETAERLIAAHAFSLRLRTLDALQLAVALDLMERDSLIGSSPLTGHCLKWAVLAGMSVVNPERTGQSGSAHTTI